MPKNSTTQLNTARSEGNTSNSSHKPKTDKVRSRGWCLTFNNYDEECYNFVKNTANTEFHLYIIGKEVGDEKKTPHLQVYLYSKSAKKLTTMMKIFEKWNPHIEKAKGSPMHNYKYCNKSYRYEQNIVKEKAEQKYRVSVIKYYEEEVKWKDWQKKIIDICESKPDDRTIHFIVDHQGNKGKSFLSKYLAIKYNAIIADGKKDNIFNQIRTMIKEEDKLPKIVIVDIPRHNLDVVNYGAIESIKNELIYSGKYEGGMCTFPPPHVLIFSNQHLDYKKFSKDRIVKIQLDDDRHEDASEDALHDLI